MGQGKEFENSEDGGSKENSPRIDGTCAIDGRRLVCDHGQWHLFHPHTMARIAVLKVSMHLDAAHSSQSNTCCYLAL